MSVFSRKKSSSTPTDHNETEPLVQDTDAMQRFTAIGKPYAPVLVSILTRSSSPFPLLFSLPISILNTRP